MWDGTRIENLQVPFYFLLLTGGTHHNFTILFSYWFSITTIKNAIVTNQKQTKLRIHSCCIFWNENWGRFSNREKRLEIQKYIFEIHLKYIWNTNFLPFWIALSDSIGPMMSHGSPTSRKWEIPWSAPFTVWCERGGVTMVNLPQCLLGYVGIWGPYNYGNYMVI